VQPSEEKLMQPAILIVLADGTNGIENGLASRSGPTDSLSSPCPRRAMDLRYTGGYHVDRGREPLSLFSPAYQVRFRGAFLLLFDEDVV
jgi:hypothetical protein